jgi:hypothetical protein
MLSENSPDPGITQPDPPDVEIEPISPEKSEVLLKKAMEPYLADEWHVLYQDAYLARLTRGMRNLDVRVDLLGDIEITESELNPLQDSGRLMAWVVLIAMLLVVMALTSALGII